MQIVERVLETRMRRTLKVDEIQFGFMPGKGIIDAVFILRRLQEEYLDKENKLYMCFVDLKKAFDRVPTALMSRNARDDKNGRFGERAPQLTMLAKVAILAIFCQFRHIS